MEIQYEVLHNSPLSQPNSYEVELTLINRGLKNISYGDWSIYFCNIMKISSSNIDYYGDGVIFTHLQGCLYKMSLSKYFKTIYPGQSLKIRYWAQNWSVAKSDVMPNWFVKAKGVKSRIIKSTAGESLNFVKPFSKPYQYKRQGPSDHFHPYSPTERYGINLMTSNVSKLKAANNRIVPKPLIYKEKSKQTLEIHPKDWVILTTDKTIEEAQFLSEKLRIPILEGDTVQKKFISLDIGKLNFTEDSRTYTDEDYDLKIHEIGESISITGSSKAGVFYGIQSLLSLKSGNPNEGFSVPVADISDGPRYLYRGVHIDVARNFHSKDCILKIIEAMALYKMNKLHLHLTDDEGWRLEIPGLPELTSIGSKRCDDMTEKTCLMSQLGSGPYGNSSVNGYYTVEDYQDILIAAKKHHIEVIPEVDMPGHARAAIKSMEARALKSTDSTKDDVDKYTKYILTDPNDQSVYESVQMFSDNALNPCVSGSLNFVNHLLKELRKMHDPIMPLKIFHFGGDEVGSGAWMKSPACDELMKPSTVTTSKIKQYFVSMISNLTSSLGMDISAWEDGLMTSGTTILPRNLLKNNIVTTYAWDNIWEWNRASRAYRFANSGYKVVMAQATHLYFDHPYEPDPEERGFYWASRFVDTRKTFGFQPDNIYANIDTKRNGEKLTFQSVCGYGRHLCEDLKKPENIIGLQCHLWSESVRTDEQVFEMIFPRLLSAAERAWHKADWEKITDYSDDGTSETLDFEEFITRVGHKELLRLDEIGITYRVPPPGSYIYDSGVLKANSAIPGLKIEYSIDNQKSWATVGELSKVITGQKIFLRTRSADGKRTSRVVSLTVP
ncbi:uncharacterized protein LOC115219984 [Argonauta hians]